MKGDWQNQTENIKPIINKYLCAISNCVNPNGNVSVAEIEQYLRLL